MSSLVSLHLNNVEYNADRIARLFPKCKPKTSSFNNKVNYNYDTASSSQVTATIDINRNSGAVVDERNDVYSQLMDTGNIASNDRPVNNNNNDKSNDINNDACNGNINNFLSIDNDESGCSRASSPFDGSDVDEGSDEVSSPACTSLPFVSDVINVSSQLTPHFHQGARNNYHHHGPSRHYYHHHHHQEQQQQQQQKRRMHKIQSAAHQYKLRDSRISEVKKLESSKEITETVFSSEIKSVKHPHTISFDINGSVIFDDIDENWKCDSSSFHIAPGTYTNSSAHNLNKSGKGSGKVDCNEAQERNNIELHKISSSTPHIIGSLPIAEYEGSPRRYGLRKHETILPNLLSSPSFTFPTPGFPQRVVDVSCASNSSAGSLGGVGGGDGGSATTMVTSTLPAAVAGISNTSFNYLYKYSETRKVLDEFFKPEETLKSKTQQFRELEYELKRRRRPNYQHGNSYVASRLAEGRDSNLLSSPPKNSQDSSEYSNNQGPCFLSNYTVSTENLGLPLEFQMSSNNKNTVYHNRYSILPDLERQFRQSRNFTLSPDTTDCESNFGESESDSSSLMLIMDPDVSNPTNGPVERLYPSMPVLEDGLSSSPTSDNDNNNATVLLMKKQITEIEREIIEKSNRPINAISVANASVTSSSEITQLSHKQCSVVPLVTVSSHHSINVDKQIADLRPVEINLESLDPLASAANGSPSSPPPPPAPAPHRDNRLFTQRSNSCSNPEGVEATIKDIRMTLQQTKTLPLRPLCVTNGGADNEDHESSMSTKSGTPIWVPRRKGAGSGGSGDEDDPDTDLETDRLLGQQRADDQGFFDEEIEKDNDKKKSRNKEGLNDPSVLIEGVLFRAKYLGSTQLVCEGQPTKATRMIQAEEAVSRIKAPEGETQPITEVDLFISTEKIMVLNTDLKEIMMDHTLRTISYIADIGDLVVLMARRRLVPHDIEDPLKISRTPKMICHVFESEEAQFIAQSIGQAFQVAYMEFLKANGIEDHSFVKEMDYQEVLNSQEIFGDELQMFAKKELQKEVVVPKMKGEILGVVIVESGWGSMLPTVVIANLATAGAAARCGQLNIGDQIIAVNGVSLVGLPLSICQNYIKNSKPHNVVKLTVVPCAPVVEVKIKRPDTKYQLGFSVQNGVICSLLRGGIAERGGVRVGHRIIEINNQSVVAVPHEKIVTLLATSVGEILMKTMPTSMFRLLTGQETPVFI